MAQEVTYCAYCGTDLVDAAPAGRRFGEPFCSEAHADAFVSEARAARVEGAALATESSGGEARAERAGDGPQEPATRVWSLGRLLKLAVCCGAPLLALVFLAGGGGALLGAGVAVLPYLALLACPLAMFFMVRRMAGHGKSEESGAGSRSASGSDSNKAR